MTFNEFLENLNCYDSWENRNVEAIGFDVKQGKWRYVIQENAPQELFQKVFYHNFNEEQIVFLKILHKRFISALLSSVSPSEENLTS